MLSLRVWAFASLISSAAFAQQLPIKHVVQVTPDQKNIVLIDREEGVYSVQHFRQNRYDLQDLVGRQETRSLSDAQKKANAILKDLREQRDNPGTDLPPRQAAPVVGGSNTRLWETKQSWSAEWEAQYSRWVAANRDPGFFARYGISTDCADVAIGYRWIFARINGLPAANTLAGTGTLVSNESMRAAWSGLATSANWYEDKLFMTALDYVMENTYTRTLLTDSYPIQINAASLVPGVHHLEFHEAGGHTLMVVEVQRSTIRVVQSTVPRELRVLSEIEYLRSEEPKANEEGFLRIRWAQKAGGKIVLAPKSSHPTYSAEQYDPGFIGAAGGFSYAVKERLAGGGGGVDRFAEFQRVLARLDELLRGRVNAVESGYNACMTVNCAPGSAAWEEYSTPTRDNRIRDTLNLASQIMKNGRDSFFQSYSRTWGEFARRQIFVEDRMVSYQTVLTNFSQGRVSSDPRASIKARWGL